MLSPIWQPKALIEKRLLKIMPIGTSMDEAIEIIEKRWWKWEILSIRDSGYGILDGGWPSYSYTPAICSKSIRVNLDFGIHLILIIPHVSVEAYFGFDDDGNLVDITVVKDYNSI
jgi:hypothetical protein